MKPSLSREQIRRAARGFYLNGFLWACGNGFLGSTLITYLFFQLGSQQVGLGIGLVLAAPKLIGLLRVIAPSFFPWLGSRKAFCLSGYVLSALVLIAVPLLTLNFTHPAWFDDLLPLSGQQTFWSLIGCWCLYHLLEYMATVALRAWMADAIPWQVRGRFLGLRERWLVCGSLMSLAANAGLLFYWLEQLEYDRPVGFSSSALIGIGFLLAAALVLWPLPHVATRATRSAKREAFTWPSWSFCKLLLFGGCFSLVNGLTQSAQRVFEVKLLGLSLATRQLLKGGTLGGQFLIAPSVGAIADHRGNRPVLYVSQILVGCGLLCYYAASAPWWWLAIGAWICWIAYAGHNICFPNLLFKLSPPQARSWPIGLYFAGVDCSYAIGSLLGGWWYDYDGNVQGIPDPGWIAMVLMLGAILRILLAYAAWWLDDPPKEIQ